MAGKKHMKDGAAHIPAILEQYGHQQQAEEVRELYAAVRKLQLGKGGEKRVSEQVFAISNALDVLGASERRQVGEEKVNELQQWLRELAFAYLKGCSVHDDLARLEKVGGNPEADVSGDHGAIATLLGGLFG